MRKRVRFGPLCKLNKQGYGAVNERRGEAVTSLVTVRVDEKTVAATVVVADAASGADSLFRVMTLTRPAEPLTGELQRLRCCCSSSTAARRHTVDVTVDVDVRTRPPQPHPSTPSRKQSSPPSAAGDDGGGSAGRRRRRNASVKSTRRTMPLKRVLCCRCRCAS